MALRKYPQIINANHFDRKGFVKTENGLLVPAYVGSGEGYNFPGVHFLQYFYPRLQQEARVLPLCPFAACGEFLDFSKINTNTSLGDYLQFWKNFNEATVGEVNYRTLMPKSKMMIALLEGHHADEGLASEIPEFLHTNKGPLVGIRSDIRLSENVAAGINPAISDFFTRSEYKNRCYYVSGPPVKETYDWAIKLIGGVADRLLH